MIVKGTYFQNSEEKPLVYGYYVVFMDWKMLIIIW